VNNITKIHTKTSPLHVEHTIILEVSID